MKAGGVGGVRGWVKFPYVLMIPRVCILADILIFFQILNVFLHCIKNNGHDDLNFRPYDW